MRSMATKEMPAVALAAVPGRRRATLDLARDIERRGFAGIYCASFGDGLGLCVVHALAPGRFRFGVGVSHVPVHERLGVRAGKPLADTRAFVAAWRAVPRVG